MSYRTMKGYTGSKWAINENSPR